MAKDKMFLVNVDIVVYAKNEAEALHKVDTQLGYSDVSDYGSPEVENYHSKTKRLKVTEIPLTP